MVNARHGRLFLAGEALHPRWSGYLQGAFASGKDKAQEVECFLESDASRDSRPEKFRALFGGAARLGMYLGMLALIPTVLKRD